MDTVPERRTTRYDPRPRGVTSLIGRHSGLKLYLAG